MRWSCATWRGTSFSAPPHVSSFARMHCNIPPSFQVRSFFRQNWGQVFQLLAQGLFLIKMLKFRERSHVSLMERLLTSTAWILGKRQEFFDPMLFVSMTRSCRYSPLRFFFSKLQSFLPAAAMANVNVVSGCRSFNECNFFVMSCPWTGCSLVKSTFSDCKN